MMRSAVLYRARAELRVRWRAWLAMGVLLGLASGAAMASAAGARRTESAYPRFLESQRALDILGDVRTPDGIPVPVERVRELSVVEDVAAVVALFAADVTTPSGRRMAFPDVFPLASLDGRFGRELNASKILEGRRPDLARDDEVLVGFSVADRFGITLGDRLQVRLFEVDPSTFAPTGEVAVHHTVEVVGIGAMPGEFQALAGASIPSFHLTPAFLTSFQGFVSPDEAFAIRLRGGIDDVDAFVEEATDAGFVAQAFYRQPAQTDSVRRSARFQAVALWLLAGLTALAAIAILGQALARQAWLEADEYPVLLAVGMSRGSLVLAGMLRSLVIAFTGASVAAGIAVASSPLMPIGLARIAEPDQGVDVDLTTLGIGAAAIMLLVLVASALPQWRASKTAARPSGARLGVERGSRLAGLFARAGASVPMVAGARLALETGHGSTAVPVRSAVVGIALGVLAVASALTFGSSMHHLVDTPPLSGWTFDLIAGGEPDQMTSFVRDLEREGVLDDSVEGYVPTLQIEGTEVLDAGLVLPPGGIGPAIADGRAPLAADEVALGRDTMAQFGLAMGDEVRVAVMRDDGTAGDPLVFRIVGRLIQPAIGFNLGSAGEGLSMTPEGHRRFGEPDPVDLASFLRLAPEVDRRFVIETIAPKYPSLFVSGRPDAGASVDVARVQGFPLVLAGLLAFMALATMAHTLMSTIRRRARDLAVLRTIGFVGSQVRGAVAWQATIVVVIAVALGAPLGLVLGRWGWNAFADALGVVPVIVTPALPLLLAVPIVVLLGNLVAALPARAAARARPAVVLRSSE